MESIERTNAAARFAEAESQRQRLAGAERRLRLEMDAATVRVEDAESVRDRVAGELASVRADLAACAGDLHAATLDLVAPRAPRTAAFALLAALLVVLLAVALSTDAARPVEPSTARHGRDLGATVPECPRSGGAAPCSSPF